jgi:hypothetical protein
VNGQVTGVKNKQSNAVVPDPSVVMMVPRKAPSLLDGSPIAPSMDDGLTRGAGEPPPSGAAAPPPPPQRSTTPGAGRLKSIGS